MKRVILFALLASLSPVAHAASLKELLEAAETANVDRQISQAQRQRAAAEFNAAWTSLLPSLGAQASYTRNQYPTEIALPGGPKIVIQPADQLDAIARIEVPLIDTTRWFRAGASSAAEDAAQFRDQATRDNVRRQVATTYYGYAAALAVRDSARRSAAVSQAQLHLQEIRARAGAATELEVLRAKAEVQRNKQTVADTDALVANNRRALRTLTGVEVDENATLPLEDLTSDGTLESLESAAAELPAVKAADKDALAASRLAWASRLALVPMLTGHFTERASNATGFTGKASSYITGVNLLWRLDVSTFFNMSAQGSNRDIAELVLKRQRLASRDQVHNDWRRLTAAIEKVTAAAAQVEAAKRAAQVARDRYVAGAATQIDVIQSERDLFGAEVNQIQSRTELASSHVLLRISAGLPLRVD